MARKDNKGRNLKTGEYQRPDGRYEYRYKDEITGKRNSVYAADLASLREMEKKINKDMDDLLITDASVKKLTVNTLFERYMATKNIKERTKKNYIRMWDYRIRNTLGFKREFSKLIGFLVVALVAVGLVFNASGVKDVLLQLFNKIIGA